MKSILVAVQPHQHTLMQIFLVCHGQQRRILHTQFTGNTEISVTSQGPFHSSLIHLNCMSLTLANQVFQQLVILLQQSTAAVIAQNAKEHILVVCEMCHTLDDINMHMLRTLARCVFRPPPHHYLAHFVQNAVCLSKFQP